MAAKTIMVQGTMSSAGKSLLAAGLCRVFAQDGYRVAPFKSQNMALNSFVTDQGLEMGRAQVVQAEAAFRKPDVRMNPILLKPSGDDGSQVIVDGEVWGTMTAREYYGIKQRLVPAVERAFRSLSEENDIVVIEGAGSPAEINLKEEDIANMFVAKLAKAPVLLVGDIDRGGVFASLFGTVQLLPEDERRLIRGLVVNKFRGDRRLLEPGLGMIEKLLGKPVLGVLPYMRIDLDDEDSLSERLEARGGRGVFDIAVIRLPRISNFTDFSPLEFIEGAELRYVESAEALGAPDLLILPGTKNTMGDLAWLSEVGLAASVLEYAARGGLLVGICGGFQMLCSGLSDPFHVEAGGEMEGLGLVDARTVFARSKVRTRVKGRFLDVGGALGPLSGVEFEGYEIHMGETSGASAPLAQLRALGGAEKRDGISRGNVYGCYVHGLFDSEGVLRGIAEVLAGRKAVPVPGLRLEERSLRAHKDAQYELLADALRQHLDMKAIYGLLEAGA